MTEENAIRLFLDEDVWLGLAAVLRERDVDVIHVYEVDRAGLSDREQAAFAIQQQRAILSHNKRDYIPFAAEYYWADREHYGILVIDQLPRGELLQRVLAFLQEHNASQVKNQVWFL